MRATASNVARRRISVRGGSPAVAIPVMLHAVAAPVGESKDPRLVARKVDAATDSRDSGGRMSGVRAVTLPPLSYFRVLARVSGFTWSNVQRG